MNYTNPRDRDLIALVAMKEIMAHETTQSIIEEVLCTSIAKESYMMADAMIQFQRPIENAPFDTESAKHPEDDSWITDLGSGAPHKQCSRLTAKHQPCGNNADRTYEGKPVCHVHDPNGEFMRQHPPKSKSQ